mgnify:FL=1
MSECNQPSDSELIGVGKCPEHGYVTEDDGATVRFPTTAECHCGCELKPATIAPVDEVRSRV